MAPELVSFRGIVMIATLAIEPVTAGGAALTEHRYRPATGERTLLQDSAQQSPASSRPGERKNQNASSQQQSEGGPEPETLRSGAANFAAAVIAGALPPTPQSMDELIRRIGASEIPQESEARLKDLIA